MTPGEITLNVVRNDPAENRYLECAAEGAADYLVTGGQDLLDLHEHGGSASSKPRGRGNPGVHAVGGAPTMG